MVASLFHELLRFQTFLDDLMRYLQMYKCAAYGKQKLLFQNFLDVIVITQSVILNNIYYD